MGRFLEIKNSEENKNFSVCLSSPDSWLFFPDFIEPIHSMKFVLIASGPTHGGCHDMMILASRQNLLPSKIKTESVLTSRCKPDDLSASGGHCRTNNSSYILIVMIACPYVTF